MFHLHQLGYPLTETMGDLTPGQVYYLLAASGHYRKRTQTETPFGG